jgi:hypothetical protein
VSETVPGGTSFVIDPTWLGQQAPADCVRLTARAQKQGVVFAQGSMRIRRGDYTVSGTVQYQGPAPAKPTAEPFARVQLLIGHTWFRTDADQNGKFTLDHLPAGRLHLVRADSGGDRFMPRRGETVPHLTLGPAQTAAQVTVTEAAPEPIVDAFEPDNAISDVTRTPLGATAANQLAPETHNLPRSDADLIPIALAQGTAYQVWIAPRAAKGADLAVAIVDGSGNVIQHVNDTEADFQPSPKLRFVAPGSGTYYVRVTRNDQESGAAPYDLYFSRS